MLWKIDNTPHRILGSIHLLAENVVLPTWAADCHHGMKRFIFESDFRDRAAAAIGIDRSGAHLAFPGATDLYAEAATFLTSLGSTEPFNGLRPWRAAFHVVFQVLPRAGLFHAHGMDNRLRVYADKEQHVVGFLESPTRAFALLDSSCEEAMAGLRFFERSLAQARSGECVSEVQRMIKAWDANDLDTLADVHREKLAEFPYVFTPIVTQRNREWVSVARDMIGESTPTLFVVGALHMVGADSFIQQLSADGFRLTRMS